MSSSSPSPSASTAPNPPSPSSAEYVPIILIGAGISSLTACGYIVRKYGKDFLDNNVLLLDKEHRIGGTWWVNRYPGCGVDTPAPFYGPSWMVNKSFDGGFWPLRDSLLEYIDKIKDQLGLKEGFNLKLGINVKDCIWLEKDNRWRVVGEEVEGGKERLWECKTLFLYVGGVLSVPKKCNIPGVETFKGRIWHSARYPEDPPSLQDKDVVIIGNGTSSAQVVPSVAKQCKSLTQFARSKHWFMSRPTPPFFGSESTYRKIGPKLFGLFPFLYTLYRIWIFFLHEIIYYAERTGLVGTLIRKHLEKENLAFMKKYTPQEYWDLVIPDYPLGCRRRILDQGENGYLSSLNLPNVHLYLDPVVEILPHSVKTKSGKEYPADVIILCTGFERQTLTSQVNIVGRRGKTLREYWIERGGIAGYDTCAVYGFPNMWIGSMGPNSITGHTTVLLNAEAVITLVLNVSAGVIEGKHESVEVREEALEKWAKDVKEALRGLVFKWEDCGNAWFFDEKTGENYTSYPYSQITMWSRCYFPTWTDWEITLKKVEKKAQ